MFNSALTRGTELDKARQETIKNLAPSIFEEMKANPNVPVQDLLVKYAQQYEVDPLTLSSNLIQYKSDREKEDLLTQKANLDLLSSKVNLLKDSGASGEIDIPGIGKVDIQKKGDFSLVQAGNSMYVFDKDTGKVQSTGLNTDQLSSNNILDAIQGLAKGDYQNPGVVEGYLGSKGVNVGGSGNSTIQIPKSSYLAYTNNNPGNLRFVGQSGATKGNGGFAKFSSPEAGFQALIDDIDAKKAPGGNLDGNSTLEQLIGVYAPPSENNTKLYVQQMATWLGVTPQTKIGQIPTEVLAKAIAKKESSTVIGSPTNPNINNNVSQYNRQKDDKYQKPQEPKHKKPRGQERRRMPL
jgi:hypothetical protein